MTSPSPFARVGRPSCFQCGEEITAQTVQQMVDAIGLLPEGSRFQILAPIVRGRKGEYRKELLDMRRAGYVRARVDGQLVELGQDIALDKQKKHTIEICGRSVVMKPARVTRRLAFGGDLVETRRWGRGSTETGKRQLLAKFACIRCGSVIRKSRRASFRSTVRMEPVRLAMARLRHDTRLSRR